MPIYTYECPKCRKREDKYQPLTTSAPPVCCGKEMSRTFGEGNLHIRMGPPLWVDRIDDIHKAQEQRGERLRLPHPREVRAT